MTASHVSASRPAFRAQGWEALLQTTRHGSYAASVGNIAAILGNADAWHGQVRYDERAECVVLGAEAPINEDALPREYTDTDDARIAQWLERSTYGIRISPTSPNLIGAVNMVARDNRFDDVRSWLESLSWDQVPRIDRLCSHYLGSEESPLLAAFGARWMISAVARALQPGCQADHVLVLVGGQGAGKSTALRTLTHNPAWLGDSPPSVSGKDASDYLRGLWVVEMAELDAMGRAEVTAIKSFITMRTDRYRPAYGRRTANYPRRCVFAGTTNEECFLRDASGNRRFWPVTVGEIRLADLEQDAPQLWAEAVHRYRSGEPWHLVEADLIEAAQESQEERYQSDAWEPYVEKFLTGQERVTVGEVLNGPLRTEREHMNPMAERRVARIFQHLGWVRRQRRDGEDGQKRWAYERGSKARC